MLLLPILLLWLRAPMVFSLPWRWTLLGLLGFALLQLPESPRVAADDATPWLVRPAAEPQSAGRPLPAPDAGQTAAAPQGMTDPRDVQPSQVGTGQGSPPATGGAPANQRRDREGTPLHGVAGQFREAGARWTFVVDADGRTYRVLENLALDRVVTALRQNASDHRWTIDATVTEFGSENYLLLTRVLRATAATGRTADVPQPAPQH